MNAPLVFDYEHYDSLNRARSEVLSRLLTDLKAKLNLRTALDVGCGAGYFSGFLQSIGFKVTAVDGRRENTKLAASRFSGVKFRTLNAEDPRLRSLGDFDFVLCFGLLYHLENPFLTIRHLYALTKSLLFIEALTFAGAEPIMGLVEETPYEDQGLNHIAFYPTEACLQKMLYRAGFSYVYALRVPPDHPEYWDTSTSRKNRTVLAASKVLLSTDLLNVVPEPPSAAKPWVEHPVAAPSEHEKQTASPEFHAATGDGVAGKLRSLRRFLKRH